MEEPIAFSVKAIFNVSIAQSIKNTINKLIDENKQGMLKKLIIQGLDDQGFIKVFNEDSFVQKIPIKSDTNDEGLIDVEIVKKTIIDETIFRG